MAIMTFYSQTEVPFDAKAEFSEFPVPHSESILAESEEMSPIVIAR